MRIFFLVSSMHGGGAERVAALLCNQWSLNGHEVILMPTYSAGGSCDYPLHDGVDLKFLKDEVGSRSSGMFNKARRLVALRRVIKNTQPDVIVSFLSTVNVIAVVASLGLKIPVFVSERSYPPSEVRSALFNRIRAKAYANAAAVVSQTQQSSDWAKGLNPRVESVVIPNPLVYPIPKTEPIVHPDTLLSSGDKLVLGVGRLVEEKGYATLVQAFSKIKDDFPQWKLAILGDGELKSDLERQIDELGCNGRVILPGRLGNLDDWYRIASLFVMTSLREGFPNSMLEATAYGIPCISLDFETGPRELISHGVSGLITPLADGSDGIAHAMQLLMSSETQRQNFSEIAAKNRGQFEVNSISDRWISLFKKYMANK